MQIFRIIHMTLCISWFAGIFYLPRIFVNIAQEDDTKVKTCLIGMAKRLYHFMHFLAMGTVISGVCIYLSSHDSTIEQTINSKHNWMYLKLLLVSMIFVYQSICNRMISNFENGLNTKSHKFYRIFNEIPLVLLIIIIALVKIKPF